MYGRWAAARIDFSRYRLTRQRVLVVSALLLAVAAAVTAIQFSAASGLLLPNGAVIGGDYIAFYAAGQAALAGDAAQVYDPAAFEAMLRDIAPLRERYGLTWQYPPTYFLLLAPFAFLAYAPGYALWTGASAAGFLAAMRGAGVKGLFLFVIVAAPSAFHAAITGQNGFLTGALLAVAALYPDKRPVAAGLAAALLTVKPQLGALIPVAYLAGGCWRAFGVAAAGALALAALSAIAFGPETWPAFIEGLRAASDRLGAGLMPLYKMATPFAGARLAGLPVEAAAAIYLVCALAAMIGVGLVWRRVRDEELRAAALVAGVFLVAPYGYYYELIVLALPVALIVRRAMEKGWLPHEQTLVTLAFLLPLLTPGEPRRVGVAWGLVVVLVVAVSVVRRIAHEQKGAFDLPFLRFASAASRPPAD